MLARSKPPIDLDLAPAPSLPFAARNLGRLAGSDAELAQGFDLSEQDRGYEANCVLAGRAVVRRLSERMLLRSELVWFELCVRAAGAAVLPARVDDHDRGSDHDRCPACRERHAGVYFGAGDAAMPAVPVYLPVAIARVCSGIRV